MRKLDKANQRNELTFEFIIIGIDDAQVFLRHPSGALVLIQANDTFQELNHLVFRLVPHRRTCIDPRDVVGIFDARFVRCRAVGMHGNGFVVFVAFLFLDFRQFL